MITIKDICKENPNIVDVVTNGRNDFKYFCDNIIQVNLRNEPLIIKEFHIHWATLFREKENTCIIAPRGHGKTLDLGVLFPLWISFYERDKSFLIISNKLQNSRKIIRYIKHYIDSNELLTSLKPPRPKVWQADEVLTDTGCNIQTAPYKENIRSSHVDYLLLDEASYFDDTSIYFQAISPIVRTHNGHVMCIGTPQTKLDLLAVLYDNKLFHSERYQAIDKEGFVLFPEQFPKKKLDQQRELSGMLAFQREYLTEMVDEETQAFPPSLIFKAYDESFRLTEMGDEGDQNFCGVDLALSYDYFVSVVVKRDGDKIYVKNIRRARKMDYRSQLEVIKNVYASFNPMRTLIDRSQYGEVFISDLEREGVFVEPYNFDPARRNALFSNLMRLLQDGNLILPNDKDHGHTQSMMDVLSKELSEMYLDKTPRTGARTFKSVGAHDDATVGLALACYAAQQAKPFVVAIAAR